MGYRSPSGDYQDERNSKQLKRSPEPRIPSEDRDVARYTPPTFRRDLNSRTNDKRQTLQPASFAVMLSQVCPMRFSIRSRHFVLAR